MTATIRQLRAELRTDSGTVATPHPRLSWIVDTDEPGWLQDTVELRDPTGTRTITDGESNLQPWPFAPLAAGESRDVTVRVRSTSGQWSEWSEPMTVYGGFIGEHGWQAKPIGHPAPPTTAQPLLLRRKVVIDRPIAHARLLWTAFGAVRAEINGETVDDSVLGPGWTSFPDRLIHETTDVTERLSVGDNVIALALGGAWYTEAYGFGGQARRIYGEQPAALAQLEIRYTDGSTELIVTDDQWSYSDAGPLRSSGIYAGETWDLRRSVAGWSSPHFDDSAWSAAAVLDVTVPAPEARIAEPVRITGERPVAEVITTPSGRLVLDFGQNLVGWLRIDVDGPAGHTITIKHAEVLEHGEIGTRPLRYAAATDTITLGADAQTWSPEFTFHGFRYVEIDDWPGELDPDRVTAVIAHSDMRRTGWFESSNPELDRLHENVVWGMRGNFLAIPTDCPQRDERLGWTGDIQVFSPTASFLYDSEAFLVSWLRNLAVDQNHLDGVVPVVSPDALRGSAFGAGPIAAWGDAATVVPWVLYQRFGDRDVLEAQYPSMRAWVDRVFRDVDPDGLWAGHLQLGDWLDPDAPPDNPAKAKTDGDLVATAYLARSLQIVADTADVLGRREDAAGYGARAERVRTAFVNTYVTPAGRMMNDAATAYALALEFDLVVDPALRGLLAARLAEVVRTNGYRISTGFVGTPIVSAALSGNGQPYAAERLLLERSTPSWLSCVRKGATTVWERWDSMLDDGSINPGEMTSFNHYALGAVADWMHRSVAGLGPAAPAYRRIRIAPQPLRALDFATARHDTPYGTAEVGWRRDGTTITVTATVPANTTATVELPGQPTSEVSSGRHRWTYVEEQPERRPLTLDSPSAAVLDDLSAFRAVVAAAERHDPDLAAHLETRADWSSSEPLRMGLFTKPTAVLSEVEEALRAEFST